MRHVEILARAPGRTAAEMYRILSEFERYPEYASVVRSVDVERAADGRVTSTWEVEFRDGVLKWTEEDTFFPDTSTLAFKQIAGDVDDFAGQWVVRDDDGGCLIRFVADLDLGIPGLGDMLEPIAQQVLEENIRAIVAGLVGAGVEFIPVTAESTS